MQLLTSFFLFLDSLIVKWAYKPKYIYFFPDNDQANLSNRVPDRTKLFDDVNSNRTYAVFISYCEIYNKYIYDLLDDTRDPITGGPK